MTKKKCKGRARKSERPLKGRRTKAAEVSGVGAGVGAVKGAVEGTARQSPWAETKTIIIPSLEDPLHEVLQFRNEHGRIRKTLTVDKWIAHKEYTGKKHGLLQARSASGTQYKLRVHPTLAHTPADPFRTAGATAA